MLMHNYLYKVGIILRTWLISQKKGCDVLCTQVPLARLARQDAVGPANRSAQHDRGVGGERRLLRRNRCLGVSEPERAAAPAPDKVAAVALPELHLDFGVVNGVADDVAVETVVLLGGQEPLGNLLLEGDPRGGLHEEVHVDLGVGDVGVVVDLRDLQVVVPHVVHRDVVDVAHNLQGGLMFNENSKRLYFGLENAKK